MNPRSVKKNKAYGPMGCTQWIKRREWAFPRGHCKHFWVERRD